MKTNTILIAFIILFVIAFTYVATAVIERAENTDDPKDKQDLIPKTQTDNAERVPVHDPSDFLILVTATCSPYMDWQSLAAYDAAKAAWPEAKVMRLLHCDNTQRHTYKYYNIMPSFYSTDCSKHPRTGDSYPPLNRPVALAEFFELYPPEKIKETYVVIMDSDTLLRKRMNHVQVAENEPVAQLASILVPKMYTAAKTVFGELTPEQLAALPLFDVGSPYILHKNDAARLGPIWRLHTNLMREDANCKHALNWIIEMYSFITACCELGFKMKVRSDLQCRFPYDESGNFCSYHYDTSHEKDSFKWNKRDFLTTDLLEPTNQTLMPADKAPDSHTKQILETINRSLTSHRQRTRTQLHDQS